VKPVGEPDALIGHVRFDEQVYRWESEDRLEEGLYGLLDSLKAPMPLRIGEAFAVVIYCTAPHVDQKSRSKWARALRYAAVNKPDGESIKSFIKRKGGVNACASRYAQSCWFIAEARKNKMDLRVFPIAGRVMWIRYHLWAKTRID
jgi:hypothetical protein